MDSKKSYPCGFVSTGLFLMIVALVFGSVVIVETCRAATSQLGTNLERVTLKLKWKHQFQFAGYYAADAKGSYAQEGLAVSIIEADDRGEAVDWVLRGKADFGIGGSELALERAKGKPVVVLGAVFQHSPLVLIARDEGKIRSVHDLVGKRVALEPLSQELIAYLRKEGISEKQLDIVRHDTTPDELVRGKVDAMSAYSTDEPFLLEKERIKYLVLSPRAVAIDFYGDIVFTSEEQIRKYPKRVASFLNASVNGWKYALGHVDEIVDLILTHYSSRHSRDHLRYEAETMRSLIMPDVVEVGYMNPGRWKHIAQTYASLGMVPDRLKLDGFVYKRRSRGQSWWARVSPLVFGFCAVVALLFLMIVAYALTLLWRKCSLDKLSKQRAIT